MTDLNFYRTLIAVAEDCAVDIGTVPVPRVGKRTIAVLQYELLADRPHLLTQEQLLFECWLSRQMLTTEQVDAERDGLWEEFRAKPHTSLLSSPLPKTYGWGLLFDDQGRVALCARESDQYLRLVQGDTVRVLTALNSHPTLTG